MHASIWTFTGDPDDLLRRYDSMLAEIPRANLRLHICLRGPRGIVIVDTCPSRDAFEAFATGPAPELRRRHGLPEPTNVEDYPAHFAITNGAEMD
jgi:hypothetical protein